MFAVALCRWLGDQTAAYAGVAVGLWMNETPTAANIFHDFGS